MSVSGPVHESANPVSNVEGCAIGVGHAYAPLATNRQPQPGFRLQTMKVGGIEAPLRSVRNQRAAARMGRLVHQGTAVDVVQGEAHAPEPEELPAECLSSTVGGSSTRQTR